MELNDEYPVYQNNLGMAYAEKGEFEKALARFEQQPGGGNRESEVGDRRSEVGGQEPDIGDRRSEVGKIEDVGDRTSDFNRTSDVGFQESPEPAPEIRPAARVWDTEAAETPEPVSEKGISRSYPRLHAVQVGAFGPLSYAAEFYLKLVEKGYSAYINEPRSDGLYLVRIGLYNSREDAEMAARRLNKVENLENFVTVERDPFRQNISLVSSGVTPAASASAPTGQDLNELREIPLEILNGNGVNGMAWRTSAYLAEHDYLIQRVANARHFNFTRTTVFYRPEHEQAAELLAGGLPEKGRLQQVDPLALQHSGIRLILGRDLAEHNDRLPSVLDGLRKKEEVAAYQAEAHTNRPLPRLSR